MKKRIFIVALVSILSVLSCKNTPNQSALKLEGYAFGTTFNIIYYDQHQRDFTKPIDSLFHLINISLSTYMATSDISKINRGDTSIVVDAYFKEVYQKSLRIYKETEGVFDPTIGILVNAWGFGPTVPNEKPTAQEVELLLPLVGFNKVELVNGMIKKQDRNIYFDFNAIAKGYALDVAGRFLEERDIQNYLIEIGGEIRARGQKEAGFPWKAGIEDPNFDGTRSVKKVIELKDESMATSGSYRKFIVDSLTGKKYTHIINTKTGYPIQNNLLSVSIIAPLDCADVDGYATAIMSMSLAEAKNFLSSHTELRGFLIYSNQQGHLETYTSLNF